MWYDKVLRVVHSGYEDHGKEIDSFVNRSWGYLATSYGLLRMKKK